MDQKIFDAEQAHLCEIYEELLEMDEDLEKQIEELNATAAEEKQDILTNLRYDVADDEVLLESYGEIETWNRYIDTYNIKSGTLSDKLAKVKLLLESPYFARITLRFDPDEEPEDYYIGRSSFSNDGYEQRIIDWRTPIAETYYNQDNGKTFYEVDGKKITVDLTLRRQFELKKSRLLAYFDTSLAIEDPMLIQSLTRRHSDKMQAITVTIQKEQNAIIRHPDVPVMLVGGIAGSGKTSVLLQRIAYLFYHKRKTLRPENVYLMTLNPVFRQYIDEVLPDLGEKNPCTLTWMEFLRMVHDPINDPGIATTKESLFAIDAKLPELKLEAEDLMPIEQKGNRILGREKILEVIRRHEDAIPTGVRLVRVSADELEEEARAVLKKRRRQEEEEEEESVSCGHKKEKGGAGSTADKEENQLQNNFGGAFSMIRGFGWLDIGHIGKRLLGKKTLTSIEWLYLRMKLTGEGNRTAEYVCIDEIQDYTWAQLKVLSVYFTNARFLLLGDEFQSIREGTISFEEIHTLFKAQGRQVTFLPLMTSYRSTPEITALFAGLLPEEEKLRASSVQREGVKPQIKAFKEEADYIDFLRETVRQAQGGEGLTAIVCVSKKSLLQVRELLDEEIPSLLGNEAQIPKSGVFLITLAYAKGLEFDHVILPDADERHYPDDQLSRHKLYTSISRATGKVTILAKGELTPLLLNGRK